MRTSLFFTIFSVIVLLFLSPVYAKGLEEETTSTKGQTVFDHYIKTSAQSGLLLKVTAQEKYVNNPAHREKKNDITLIAGITCKF